MLKQNFSNSNSHCYCVLFPNSLMSILFYFKSDIYYRHLWHLYANNYIDEVLILVKFGIISKYNGVVCATVGVLLLFIGIDRKCLLYLQHLLITRQKWQMKCTRIGFLDVSQLIFVSVLGNQMNFESRHALALWKKMSKITEVFVKQNMS